ncbi:MAG: carbohydrate kinase [Eubacteriales bacterium]|nr:carbohydrate kinase [Eubacteriales bacterium]
MKRVVAIGELLIDFVPGERGCALREVTHFERVAGGAPANVAAAVSRLGGRGVMVSQVGDDAFGEHIIDVLKTNGVDTTYVFKTKKANTGLAFVSLDATGNREFSFFRNPSADLFLSPKQITEDMLADAGILHFCSVDLVDWPVRKAHERLIELARQKGVIVSFDPNVRLPLWDSPAACQKTIREFLPMADVIKLSDDELEFVTGCADEAEAAEKLLSGPCRMLILTKGGAGSSVYTRGAMAHIPAISVEHIVDTTGAGDSFAGSFLFQLVQKSCTLEKLDELTEAELQEMIRFSSRYAALTIGKKGAVMADMQEMKQVYG